MPENPFSSHSGGIDGAPNLQIASARAIRSPFNFTSGADQTTIGKVIDNKKYRSGKY